MPLRLSSGHGDVALLYTTTVSGSPRDVTLGAAPAGFQPQDDVRVLLDPAGHPFCLFTGPAGSGG
jgi:hypothetical protein